MNEYDAIIDAVVQVGKRQLLTAEVVRLQCEIVRVGNACGDCNKWMKSSECPLERNVNGYNRGPHMNHAICGSFAEKPWATERRSELIQKREVILLELKGQQ